MRRLTEEEIHNLSFEMKVCYMLQSWNNLANPQTPEEWAREVGFFNYKKRGTSNSDPDAIDRALFSAQYHINFIKKYIDKN